MGHFRPLICLPTGRAATFAEATLSHPRPLTRCTVLTLGLVYASHVGVCGRRGLEDSPDGGEANVKPSTAAEGSFWRVRLRFKHSWRAFQQVSILRHAAIFVAVFAAYGMRRDLQLSERLFWLLGATAILNVSTHFLALTLPRAGLSPAFGICAWTAVVYSTGGVSSPFIGGYWLEIILSAILLSPWGTLGVTAAAAAALCAQQAFAVGIEAQPSRLWLQSAFILGVGLLTFYASRRWTMVQQRLAFEALERDQRLQDLDRQLEDARVLGQLGERAARVSHSLKSAVSSLRGFADLIEAPKIEAAIRQRALRGMRLVIDRIDDIARATLRDGSLESPPRPGTTAAELERTLCAVIDEVGRLHGQVKWKRPSARGLAPIAFPAQALREVLLILAENAAEAAGVAGEVAFKAFVEERALQILVQDNGVGIAPRLADALFRPGVTSKPTGNGIGLFVARRLVESHGGQLTAAPSTTHQGGALFSVSLPLDPR